MRSREMVFESSCLPLWNIFFPPFKTQEKSEDIKKKTLIVSNVFENKKKCERRAKIQWCRSGFYHHVMLKFWNITILEIQAPVSSERDE